MILQRLRAMMSIGWATDRLASRVKAREIAANDAARAARHGPHGEATARMQKHAQDIDKITKSL